MRFVLDTHVWLWSAHDPARLNADARELLEEPAHEAFISVASLFEVAIKWSIGKLKLREPPAEWAPRYIAKCGYQVLPVEMRHALRVSTLPQHHADPFDRLLIAQALEEDLFLLTADPEIRKYDVRVIVAT
jgi:PIN domain nuclease of toxin-antitoxin system